MSTTQQLRLFDHYGHYTSKIEEIDRQIRHQARKGHGRRKIRDFTPRIYRNGTRVPTGVHDYNNMQWDSSIFRGRTFRDFREKNLSPNASVVNFDKYCCMGCNAPSGPSSKRKPIIGLPRIKVGGVFRPTTDDIMFEESSGRKRHKQDESRKEMEPFIIEQLDPPVYQESGAQSDETKDPPRRRFMQIAIGSSKGTQADICIMGTGHHDDTLEPLLKNVGSKVLQQSLLETMEEHELHVIRADIRKLVEKRRNRQVRDMTEVQHQLYKTEMLELEKERRAKELETELEADELIAATCYSINVCNNVVSQTFDSLRHSKFLTDENQDAVAFLPTVYQNIYHNMYAPSMLVDDIIKNVEDHRLTSQRISTLNAKYDSQSVDRVEELELLSEEEELSSFGAPPNTASSLPFTTSEEEEENDVKGVSWG